MMLSIPPDTRHAHDGQIELIARLLAERSWETAPAEIPLLAERTGAIEMALAVLRRPDLRQGYQTAGILTAEHLGAQINQVMTFMSAHGGHRARLVWAPLSVAEAFSMIRWLLARPAKGGAR